MNHTYYLIEEAITFTFDDMVAMKKFKEISEGISILLELHAAGVIHNNIKPVHIMFRADYKCGCFKLLSHASAARPLALMPSCAVSSCI